MCSVLILTSSIKHTGNLDAETHPVLHIVWFEQETALYWKIIPYLMISLSRRFEGTCRHYFQTYEFSRFQVLRTELPVVQIFWDVMLCHCVNKYMLFEGAYFIFLQGNSVEQNLKRLPFKKQTLRLFKTSRNT